MKHRETVQTLSQDEQLLDDVRTELTLDLEPVTTARVAAALRSTGHLLGATGSLIAADRIKAELTGLGPLQSFLNRREVTDIFVNSPQEVWLRDSSGLTKTDLHFVDEAQVLALAKRLAAAAGKRLDDVVPYADVQLPGGIRVHAVMPPISARGTLISIRIARLRAFQLAELISCGMLCPQSADLVKNLVMQGLNVLISGATGSGKTTLLSTLLGLCPRNQRIVLVEDTAELNAEHPQILQLQSRAPNIEGSGGVVMSQLIHEALRMNPDRLIVGECRGAEVRELLTALNTGHIGGGTVHANSARDVPARLQSLGSLAGLSPQAVAVQAASAIDVVLHLENAPEGRRLSEIGMFTLASGVLGVELAAEYSPGELRHGTAWPQLRKKLRQ
ncbi:TadA family conjugal transfer-associated ATPase [Psychromicrobium lacuslunae]|uniref:TadA family conjugal transfer-associated ATPase n=1 Tax=Psychromicrobium lacuslunae TaxID=1618207 RepID=UPI0005D3F451|nr:TadA family conjugal transfer-associated ATPase [Psychromicrobium lacuslunae]